MTSFEPLPRSFYARPAAVVAEDCLGKSIVFEGGTQVLTGRIVEAEAYLGPRDRAAHCFAGRRTPRNEVMYGPPGFAYVFFVYGMHFQFNLVTEAVESPAAVLIRAVEPGLGEALMQSRRRHPKRRFDVTNGPGKLCQAFGITREYNGLDLCDAPIYLSHGDTPRKVRRCPRIGVDYAGGWAKRLLRFVDAESAYLSVPPHGSRRGAR